MMTDKEEQEQRQNQQAHTRLRASETLIRDQREANQQLVCATIAAQEAREEAEAARVRAEQSEAELRQVAEFRELFIAIMAHDLRNPLSSILISSQVLLEREGLDSQQKRMLSRISDSSRRMSRMIMQLLDLARVRLGSGIALARRPTDLAQVCADIASEFGPDEVKLETQGDLSGIWDADRLAEVISNLVGNGIEHATAGLAVLVSGHADEQQVVLEISNQGKPIDAAVLPFIFEPFRSGKRRQPSTKGNLGLGLFIANAIVQAHGGSIEVASGVPMTTFTVRLPRHPAPGVDKAAA